MNSIDIAWAAGLLEGEGSFLWRKTNSAKISCAMTDKDVVDRLQNLFGGHTCSTTKSMAHHKDAWVWYIHGQDAVEIMKMLLPWMGERRSAKIKEVIKFHQFYLETSAERARLKQEDVDKAVSDYRRGKGSLRAVAKQHGISHVTLKNWLDKDSEYVVIVP